MGKDSAGHGAVRGFDHPAAFWAGTLTSSAGVLPHLPMTVGVTLILSGLPLVLYRVLTSRSSDFERSAARVRVRPLGAGGLPPVAYALRSEVMARYGAAVSAGRATVPPIDRSAVAGAAAPLVAEPL